MDRASRPYIGPEKRRKKEVQCACCGEWFPPSRIEKDHRIPCGSLKCFEDIPGFIERLTPESPDAFQMLCETCHNEKTQSDRKRLREAA